MCWESPVPCEVCRQCAKITTPGPATCALSMQTQHQLFLWFAWQK